MTTAKTIILDCDGVLTDGKVRYHENGGRSKEFHSRDIPAIKRLIKSGFEVIILSASSWNGLKYFANRCGCQYVIGIKDKAKWLTEHRPDLIGNFIAVCDDYDDFELCKMAYWVLLPKDHAKGFIDEIRETETLVTELQTKGGKGLMCEVWRFLKNDDAI